MNREQKLFKYLEAALQLMDTPEHNQDFDWYKKRDEIAGVVMAGEEQFTQIQLQDRFWYNTKCQTCGAVNEKAEDSHSGWRFYTPDYPQQSAVTYTCPNCPALPNAKAAFEN